MATASKPGAAAPIADRETARLRLIVLLETGGDHGGVGLSSPFFWKCGAEHYRKARDAAQKMSDREQLANQAELEGRPEHAAILRNFKWDEFDYNAYLPVAERQYIAPHNEAYSIIERHFPEFMGLLPQPFIETLLAPPCDDASQKAKRILGQLRVMERELLKDDLADSAATLESPTASADSQLFRYCRKPIDPPPKNWDGNSASWDGFEQWMSDEYDKRGDILRDAWLYSQCREGHTNAEILRRLENGEGRIRDFAVFSTPRLVKVNADKVADYMGWKKAVRSTGNRQREP